MGITKVAFDEESEDRKLEFVLDNKLSDCGLKDGHIFKLKTENDQKMMKIENLIFNLKSQARALQLLTFLA